MGDDHSFFAQIINQRHVGIPDSPILTAIHAYHSTTSYAGRSDRINGGKDVFRESICIIYYNSQEAETRFYCRRDVYYFVLAMTDYQVFRRERAGGRSANAGVLPSFERQS